MTALMSFDGLPEDNDPELEAFLRAHVPSAARFLLPPPPPKDPTIFRGTVTTNNELIPSKSAFDEPLLDRALDDEAMVTVPYEEIEDEEETLLESVLSIANDIWEDTLELLSRPMRMKTIGVTVGIAVVGIGAGMMIGSAELDRAPPAPQQIVLPAMTIQLEAPTAEAEPAPALAVAEQQPEKKVVAKAQKPRAKNRRVK